MAELSIRRPVTTVMFFVSLCVVALVAARAVFPKEVREELHEEMEELKDHGHHGAQPPAEGAQEPDGPKPDGEKEEP